MKESINELLEFYGRLGRSLTFLEIYRLGGEEPVAIDSFLNKALKSGAVVEDDGFFTLKKFGELNGLKRREQDFLLDKKWQKLLCLKHWFNWVPFLDFILVSGSMALGNVSAKSDFDVLVGVKAGRIFTARYFLLFIFALLRARRSDDKEGSNPDRFCFNHFVTPATYSKPPYNFYRRELYANLVPIYGSVQKIEKFIAANYWANSKNESLLDLRFTPQKLNFIRFFLELILDGRFGNWLENKVLGSLAKKRLGQYVLTHAEQGRVVVNNEELEFHFSLPYER